MEDLERFFRNMDPNSSYFKMLEMDAYSNEKDFHKMKIVEDYCNENPEAVFFWVDDDGNMSSISLKYGYKTYESDEETVKSYKKYRYKRTNEDLIRYRAYLNELKENYKS